MREARADDVFLFAAALAFFGLISVAPLVVVALWPATAYGAALVRVLDRLGGEHRATGLRRRGAALLLIGLVPVLVLGSLAAGYVGAAALGDTGVEIVIGLALALALSFSATVATVAIIYKVFPQHPPGWPATLRGALFAAGSMSMLSVAYIAYLRLGANFEQRYASDALAAVVLLGVWLFAANIALLAGYRVARHRAGRAEGGVSSAE